jgi:hypothetical protein
MGVNRVRTRGSCSADNPRAQPGPYPCRSPGSAGERDERPPRLRFVRRIPPGRPERDAGVPLGLSQLGLVAVGGDLVGVDAHPQARLAVLRAEAGFDPDRQQRDRVVGPEARDVVAGIAGGRGAHPGATAGIMSEPCTATRIGCWSVMYARSAARAPSCTCQCAPPVGFTWLVSGSGAARSM